MGFLKYKKILRLQSEQMYYIINIKQIYVRVIIMNSNIDYDKLPHNNILCVDMKSFFASVEAVLRGMDPMQAILAVVGDTGRESSVVLAASPLLKEKYNIKTGNRLYEIPGNSEINIVNARMGIYLEVSLQITRLFNNFVPLDAIHVYSIDESWIKLDGTERLWGQKYRVAKEIKNELLSKFGLYCSMGLGPNMFLAKVAMDIEGKKKGFVEWDYNDVPIKLWPVDLGECWGIGSRLKRQFNKLGIKTVGELAKLSLNYLENRFGIMGSQLYYHARGIDLSRVEGHYRDKLHNLGRGITLLHDYKDKEEIKTVIDFIKRKPDGLALGMNFNIFNAIRYCIKNIISAKIPINFLFTSEQTYDIIM